MGVCKNCRYKINPTSSDLLIAEIVKLLPSPIRSVEEPGELCNARVLALRPESRPARTRAEGNDARAAARADAPPPARLRTTLQREYFSISGFQQHSRIIDVVVFITQSRCGATTFVLPIW